MKQSAVTFFGRFARIAGGAAAVIGLFGLAGWVFDVEPLKGIWVEGVTMKINTAVCIVLTGVAIVLLSGDGRGRHAAQVLAALAAVVGGMTFVEHLTNANFGIDELLMRDSSTRTGATSPGRMGPPAAMTFLLVGTGLVLTGLRRAGATAAAQAMGLLAGLVALVPLVGYAYESHALYIVSRVTGTALHTAVALWLLSAGLVALRPATGLMSVVTADDAGGIMARRLLLPAMLIPFALGWLRTMGERAGWLDESLGRPVLVLALMVSLAALVWWSARAVSAFGRFRAEAEAGRRRGQEELRASEDRYRSFIRLSSEGIWRFELDEPVATDLPVDEQVDLFFRHGYLAECNDAMARMYGLASADQIVGRRLTEFHPPEKAESREFLRSFVHNGYRAQDVETEELDRDGRPRVFLNSFVGSVEDGRLLRVWGTQRDVTDQRRAEAALRASERQMRLLTDALPALLGYVDRDLRYRFNNRAYLDWFGTAPSDLVGKHLRDLLGDQSFELRRPYIERALRGETVRFEATARDKGRGPVDSELLYVPDVGPDGEVRGFVVLAQDITERKRDQNALRESEERLRLALSIARMGTFLIDLRTDAVTVNEAGREIYGWPEGEALTFAKVQSHFHPDDKAEVLRRVAAAFEPDGPGEFEVEQRIVRTDGAVRWIRVRGRTLFESTADGRRTAVRCVGTYLDVTDQKEAEHERERLLEAERAARAEAERASRSKDEFLATLSHELRTPLTPVLLTVSLMESRPDLPEELRDDVASIRRNVELESRLISDLLDLTRIANGKLQLEEGPVDLHLAVRSAVDICQREASAKLTVDLRATHTTVFGDSTRLQQVFWNLINNAIKFTGPEGTITVRSRDLADGRVRVEVSDTGAGIDPSVLPRLFNAFEQGDVRSSRKQAGLGLGLAISRKLVEAHGGAIAASSEGRGHGATFTVDLPASAGSVTVVAPAAAPTQPGAVRPLEVLVVEDHEPTLRVMSRLLRGLGHRVTGATTVASATAAASQGHFDVIISDLGLPDGSGLDVMRNVRDRYAGRAIALTGYGMESDVMASLEAGFAAHLTKPVDVHQLRAAIDQIGAGAN